MFKLFESLCDDVVDEIITARVVWQLFEHLDQHQAVDEVYGKLNTEQHIHITYQLQYKSIHILPKQHPNNYALISALTM